jgi:hypothetical protein
VSIGQGQTRSGTFFYRDTRAGAATLQVSVLGFAALTQTVVVAAAQPAKIVLAPTHVTLRVGQRRIFTARLSDPYGNRVTSPPTWSVTTGHVASIESPAGGTSVRARALSPGRAILRARAGRAVGSALILVRR